jgi:hypothetical protein
MPIVGELTRFAIEYELNADFGGAWMFGRLCYWVERKQVGDYELGASLRDVLFQLDQIGGNKRRRESARLMGLPAADAFHLLDAALFGAAEINNANLAEEEQWALFNVIPSVDVFDGWKAFLIENDRFGRILYASDPYMDVHEILLNPGELDAVVDEVRGALYDLYERVNLGNDQKT